MVVDLTRLLTLEEHELRTSVLQLESMERLWRDILARSELSMSRDAYEDTIAFFENRSPEMFKEIRALQHRNETLQNQLRLVQKRIEYFTKKP